MLNRPITRPVREGAKTHIVSVVHKLYTDTIVFCKVGEIVGEQVREKAVAAISTAKTQRETGSLFANFVREFIRRQGRRWRPSTGKGNARLRPPAVHRQDACLGDAIERDTGR